MVFLLSFVLGEDGFELTVMGDAVFCVFHGFLNGKRKKEVDNDRIAVHFLGDPWENRTPVTAVKGRCLSRLTNGPK